MKDILNRLEVQCQSDLHDDFSRSLFAEAAVEIERQRKDAARYRWLRDTAGDVVQAHILSQRREADEWDDEIDAAMKGANH